MLQEWALWVVMVFLEMVMIIQGESYLGTGSSGNTNIVGGGGGSYPRRGDNADSGAGGGYGGSCRNGYKLL